LKVWDALVRVAHWTLLASVLGAWFTRGAPHEWIGYAALAVVSLRIAWGFLGSPYARFSQFVRRPAATLTYARSVARRKEARYLGHNPLGGWMVVALLAAVTLTGLSGWLSVTERFWGVEWVQETHEALANALAALAFLHVAGVAYTSARHRENLVRAMLTGSKPPPGPGDVLR
jgi:cytochrome b